MSPRSCRPLPLLIAISGLVGFGSVGHATVPAPQTDEHDTEVTPPGGPHGRVPLPDLLGPFNYVRELDQTARFLQTWQLFDPDSSDHGGEIEAESGDLGDVIQTDNTLEAIWVWSRYREITGRATYDPNVAAAWIYSRNFPAWLEEGPLADNYYRAHNCAWGLTTVLKYEAATGDVSTAGYADSCAQYILDYPLVISNGTIWQQRLDAFTKGWVAGNLYLYAEARGDGFLMAEAVTQGMDVLNWLDANAALNLTLEYWAMSSGTSMWGVCNSVFRDDPGLGTTWLTANAPLMDVWQEWYDVPGFDWDSAWNVAYANAHFAVWDALGDDTYWTNGVAITDNLLSLDTDDDGGIVSSTQHPETEDMTWVSSYLVKFGVDRLLGQPLAHDVGPLRFVGIDDGDVYDPGTPVPVIVLATNYGLSDEVGVEVRLEGDAGSDMTVIDLPFAALDSIPFVTDWVPPVGVHTLTAFTGLVGDENTTNDTLQVTFEVMEPIGIPDADVAQGCPRVIQNPFQATTGFTFHLTKPADVVLDIFDLTGRHTRRLEGDAVAAGEQRMEWDGRDGSGQPVAAGVYVYRLSTGSSRHRGKLVRLP